MQDNALETTVSDVEHGGTAEIPPHHVDVDDGVQPSSAERPSEPTDDSSTAAPDGGYGWVVVFAAGFVNFICDGIKQSFGVFYVELLDYFGASRAVTSLIGSTTVGLSHAAGLLAGYLVNRYGCRAVTIAGSVIGTFGLVVSRLAASVNMLILTHGSIVGFGFGLMYLPSVVAVSNYFEKRRALATGLTMTGSSLGAIFMPPSASVLFRLLDWKNAMLVVAAVACQGCVFGSLLRPLRLRTTADRIKKRAAEEQKTTYSSDVSSEVHELLETANRSSKLECGQDTKSEHRTRLSRLLEVSGLYLLTDPVFLCLLVGNLVGTCGYIIPYYFTTDRAIILGVERTHAAFLLSAIGITNMTGRVLVGIIADSKLVSSLLLQNVAVLSMGVACIMVRFCVVYWAMVVCALLQGLCFGTWLTMLSVVLCDLLGVENLSSSFGLLLLVRGVSMAAGPPLIVAVATLFSESNVYDVSFAIAGAMFLAGGAIFCLIPVFLRRRHRTLL